MKKYIVTGGPCTGKSTLLESVAEIGYSVVPEAARDVILQESPDGDLPWTNVLRFQQKVVLRQKELENICVGEVIFLDRGLPDNIAYCELAGENIGENIIEDIKNAGYEDKVFVLDRLPLFENDELRKEDINQAIKIHDKLCEVYQRLGFDVVRVPVLSVENRRGCVIASLKNGN